MNELMIFENKEFGSIRAVTIDGEPWMVGKDVAAALGYGDTFGALKKHVDEEDKQNCQNDSFRTPRGMTIINESGLYSLVLSSKFLGAKKFKRWVTSEVLPSIREHGGYIAGQEAIHPLPRTKAHDEGENRRIVRQTPDSASFSTFTQILEMEGTSCEWTDFLRAV